MKSFTSDMEQQRRNTTDHLANERTFLAWIRTGIAIMAFGFVVVKFALFMKQVALLLDDSQKNLIVTPGKGYSSITGIALVALGTLLVLLAFIRYKNIENKINNNQFVSSLSLSLALTIGLIIVGIILVIYLSQSA